MLCIYNEYEKIKVGAVGAVPKSKDNKKSGTKDSQLILRLDKDERDEFVALCKEMDTSAAREIRHFIRSYIKKHK
ncbi:hypothetical protein [Nioella nitratireducens]|uniref:hypothetical protein n=1 Tax=Nioella nitratireducens TaxID=1287720 RepID=UPI0008FD121D|nr:hypothetical protein [Nioella nitratireducens]